MGAEHDVKNIKLWQPDDIDTRWHIFVSTNANWIPSYPPADANREAIQLLKRFKFKRYSIQMPSQDKARFIADFWVDSMPDDVNVYHVFEHCHRHFNSTEYSAQITLEDGLHGVDPAWEFPIAYYKSGDTLSSTGFAHFRRTHIGYDEAYTIFNSTPKECLYFTGTAILLCREKEVSQGKLSHAVRGSVEEWGAYIHE